MTATSTKESQWLGLVLPALYIVAVVTIDYYAPIGTITPFCVVMALLFMALKCRPVVMIPWAIIYTAIVCCIFLIPRIFTQLSGHAYYDQYVIPSLRAATYVVVGTLSVYLCLSLNRLRNTQNELNQILENLPWPIFTSDHHGMVLYWNQAAEKILPVLRNNPGVNYFDLLAAPQQHGKTITDYLRRIDQDNHQEPLSLSVNGVSYKGHTRLIEWGESKVMLTILSEKDVLSTFSGIPNKAKGA